MILKELKIDTWIGDPTNCYIILDEKSKETMVIDPAGYAVKIEELKHIGVNMTYKGRIAGTNELVTDKKFVITGTITGWGRNEIKDKLESFNAKVSGSVSKNTDIVIVGANPGSKYQDALNLGITIWDEAKTLEVLNNLQ